MFPLAKGDKKNLLRLSTNYSVRAIIVYWDRKGLEDLFYLKLTTIGILTWFM